ncbi:alpha-mannosidase At3g26720-like isoform X1 [Olea europaea subsp. europaea]|uniref:ATP:AMP phosphotransferase n=1 Tax=Olea europaea subsp. europaea TaxID=158383 RepID=A0A8S0UVK8_OLEEU|nr:alpha-mannosidase At3g26720-like isoform X1 [Olea europaea subsp. europaea]
MQMESGKLIFTVAAILAGLWLTRVEPKYIAYNTTSGIVPDKINVHLVPHSHDDVGWLKTVDQYFVGANNSIRGACVQNVLDSVIAALLDDKNRKFIYVEMAFFQRWWRQQSETLKTKVKELVNSGQLEFVNGGMCMHDEATTHYIDLIDQTTLGHRFIEREFGQKPRVGWQIDPFGHSAVQAYLLGAELGFDSLYFARIDYQDRAKRKDEKALEVIWRGSRSLSSSCQIFTGIFPIHYDPPDGFTFEINDVSPPIQDDDLLFDYNVEERVNDFVAAALLQANVTRTNHIMWTMGTDFRYQYATSWFRQMDKFIHYVKMDGRVNALYSTPSIYTDAKHAANEQWPLKTGDFFPYADHENAYWTGYFTSRPALKRHVREMSGYFLAARQLEFFKGRNSSGPSTDALADALAIAQHHDAVSGTERQHVASDYALRLSIGYKEAEKVVASSLALLTDLRLNTTYEDSVPEFQQCPLLNISYCPPSEAHLTDEKSLIIIAYNALGWKRKEVIRIPVSGPGSGKGTQCAKIVQHFGYTHLSAGDLLREEIKSGSENGTMIQNMIKEGKLVPSELTVKLLQRAMNESGNDKFLIDGFPRNEENRVAFESVIGIVPEFVLFFDCSEEEMERRLLSRNQGREDDNIETIKKRFKVFMESLPVIEYYNSKEKVRKIDAGKPVEEVFEAVKAVFTSSYDKVPA